jgi:hypothetical protein
MTDPLVYGYIGCMQQDHRTPVNHNKDVAPMNQFSYYTIRIKGLIDPHWDWLEKLTVTHLESGETILSGPISDQAALHGLLIRIRDLNLTLIAVYQIDPKNLTD